MNQVFSALAHPVRRKILGLLKEGDKSAGELSSHFDLTAPTMSVHFKKLKQADLVSVQRQGTTIFYAINTSVLEEALSGILSLKE